MLACYIITMSLVMHALLVVAAPLDAVAAELVTQIVAGALAHVSPPGLDHAEHELSPLAGSVVAILAHGRVVENTVDDALEGALDVDSVVVPALDYLGDDPLHGLRGDLSCWFVEDVAEVVFREHRVRRIRGVVVTEDDELLVAGALDDLGGASRQLVLDLADDREYVRSEEGKDKYVHLFLDLLNEIWEHWDFLDRLRNSLHDLVVVLENWIYLPGDLI